MSWFSGFLVCERAALYDKKNNNHVVISLTDITTEIRFTISGNDPVCTTHPHTKMIGSHSKNDWTSVVQATCVVQSLFV